MAMQGPTIFVLNRGWVIVALWEQDTTDFLQINLGQASTVRRWGTTNGLGELAQFGPKSGTILDAEPTGGTLRKSAVMRTLKCNAEAWQSWVLKSKAAKSPASGSTGSKTTATAGSL